MTQGPHPGNWGCSGIPRPWGCYHQVQCAWVDDRGFSLPAGHDAAFGCFCSHAAVLQGHSGTVLGPGHPCSFHLLPGIWRMGVLPHIPQDSKKGCHVGVLAGMAQPSIPSLLLCPGVCVCVSTAPDSLHSLGFCWHLAWLEGDLPLPCPGDSKLSGKVFPRRIDFS